jgi:hypothetical protein
MRFVLMLAAALSLVSITPRANAASIFVSGIVTGYNSIWTCTPGAPIPCDFKSTGTPSFAVGGQIPISDPIEGLNTFDFYFQGPHEGFSGQFSYIGGVLTPILLSYLQYTCPASPTPGCIDRGGSTTSFQIGASFPTVPGVPEPTTWLLMLIGFGAIGYAIRRPQLRLA